MKTKLIAGVAILAAAMIIVRCGNVIHTGNPSTISGILYSANGVPASHALVRFYPVNYNPQNGGLAKTGTLAAVSAVPILDTITDAAGRYSANLDSGSYNLLASSDTTQAYHDSIIIKAGDTLRLADTLRAPGSLQGVIRMQNGDDPRTVFIIFIGTGNVYVPQDSIGNFCIQNLAQGSYHVRFLSTLNTYNPKDTNLTVSAGKIDTLGRPIALQYTGIPVPTGLRIQYDTNMQVVTLTWNPSFSGSGVKGYQVYRNNAAFDILPTAINGPIVTDTMYRDSTGAQDSGYEYYVAVVDTQNSVGVMSQGVLATIRGRYEIFDSIPLPYSEGPTSIAMSSAGQLFAVRDSFILNYNPIAKSLTRSWTIPDSIGKIQNAACLNDSLVIVDGQNALIELSTNSGSIVKWNSPDLISGYNDLGAANSLFYFTTGMSGLSGYQICALNPSSGMVDTIVNTTQAFAALGADNIQGIFARNNSLTFAVQYRINDADSEFFNVYSSTSTGGSPRLLMTIPWYTNQNPCFAVVNDSIFMATGNKNTGRLIVGSPVAKWSFPLGSVSIAAVNSRQIYVSGYYDNIYIYQQR